MPGRIKLQAIAAFVLAVLLALFFQIGKHQPALAQVNAFAEDPYDAVGSFGVQFAMFTALLSLVRAFRPYQAGKVADIQAVLFARGLSLTYASIAVVLASDVVAVIRYSALWIGTPAGYTLTALLAGMVLCTMLVAWFSHGATRAMPSSNRRATWIKAGGIFLASILILALYPESWRQSIPGALFTALTGMFLFFIAVWAWGIVTAPAFNTVFEDFIDDLASLYRWLKGHLSVLKPLFALLEKMQAWPLIGWLNPRKHPWHGIILAGIFMGLTLAFAEVTGEGGADPRQVGRLITVIAIFVGLESAGVVLGYALLARPLGLFRRDSAARPDDALVES